MNAISGLKTMVWRLTVVAVGNANPVSLESYQQSQRKAWQGRALVVGHPAADLTLRSVGAPSARSTGMKVASGPSRSPNNL